MAFHGFRRGPGGFGFSHRGPFAFRFGWGGGLGMAGPFSRRGRGRRDYAKWLRRYKEDLEDELREVTEELQRLEREGAGAGPAAE